MDVTSWNQEEEKKRGEKQNKSIFNATLVWWLNAFVENVCQAFKWAPNKLINIMVKTRDKSDAFYVLRVTNMNNFDFKSIQTTHILNVSYSILSFADRIWTMIAIWQACFLRQLNHQRGTIILQQIFRVFIAILNYVILVMIWPCVKCYSGEEALNI